MGEPLLLPISYYEAAFEIIEKLRQELCHPDLRITHRFQTNGTLITQEWCDFVNRYQTPTQKVYLTVSLDGPAFLHDKHRKNWVGQGTHAKIMQGIQLLRDNEITVRVLTVLTGDSIQYPEELFHFYVNNHIDEVGFNIEEIEGFHKQSSLLKLSDAAEKYQAFLTRFFELNHQHNEVLYVRELEVFLKVITKYSRKNYISELTVPFTSIAVDPQGNCSTWCPELLTMKNTQYEDGNFFIGNLLQDDSLESMLRTEKYLNIQRDISSGVEMCRQTCDYFALCGGGEPADKYSEKGTMEAAEISGCVLKHQVVLDAVMEHTEKYLVTS